MLQNLVLMVTYLHYFVVLEQIVVLLVDPSLDLMSIPLLVVGLEILAHAWAFFGVFAHLIFVLA
jgi:hypothetical protein